MQIHKYVRVWSDMIVGFYHVIVSQFLLVLTPVFVGGHHADKVFFAWAYYVCSCFVKYRLFNGCVAKRVLRFTWTKERITTNSPMTFGARLYAYNLI